MTNLPANLPTYWQVVAVEAKKFVLDLIASHREPGGIFHPDAEEMLGKELMKHVAQFHPFFMDDIAYFAEHGNEQAHLALNELIAE